MVRYADEGRLDDLPSRYCIRRTDKYLGELYLDEITRDVLWNLVGTLRKTIAPATVNRTMNIVRAILNKACREWEWIDTVPKVPILKTDPGRIRWITRTEAELLLKELPEHLLAMAEFTLATGLRRANVTGLEWSQIDMTRSVAWIHPDQAKSRRAIGVKLNQTAKGVLIRRIGKHQRYVFTYHGKRIRQTSTKAWYSALERAGIEDFRWHDLRHTWASWHVQAGTPLHILKELGGWAKLDMVLRYAHLGVEHLAEYVDNVELDTHNSTHTLVESKQKAVGATTLTA